MHFSCHDGPFLEESHKSAMRGGVGPLRGQLGKIEAQEYEMKYGYKKLDMLVRISAAVSSLRRMSVRGPC